MESKKAFHLGCEEGDLGKTVILTGDPKRCSQIAQYFENPKLIADVREYVSYTGYLNNKKVSVVSTGIGGPSTAIAVEECYALGVRNFIRVGTCGGISKDVKPGDLVIATGAVRQDGTTKEYAPIEFPAVADFDLTYYLKKAAETNNFSYHLGIVQSKDSFYGQHSPITKPVSYELINKWEAYKKLNVLCSEMECSTVYCVSSYLKARAACVLLCILNQELDIEEPTSKEALNTEKAIITAIQAIKNNNF